MNDLTLYNMKKDGIEIDGTAMNKDNTQELSDEQIKLLRKLWFIYGNNGKKHSHNNHRFIQNYIEHGEDTREFYLSSTNNDLTRECIDEVDKILQPEDNKTPENSEKKEIVKMAKDKVAISRGYFNWEVMEDFIVHHNSRSGVAQLLVCAMEEALAAAENRISEERSCKEAAMEHNETLKKEMKVVVESGQYFQKLYNETENRNKELERLLKERVTRGVMPHAADYEWQQYKSQYPEAFKMKTS